MRLKPVTRGMSDPKGKPKVYFSCHPDDFDQAFPVVSEDILRHANCAVWYDEEPDVPVDEQERDKALILNRLGGLYRETGEHEKAEDCFIKAGRIFEKQAGEIGTQRARRDLSVSYERLGDIYRKKGEYDWAEE